MNNGFVVYWPSVPVEVDFLVEREDRLDRIQVKYASWNKHDKRGTYESLHARTYGWTGGRKKEDEGPKYDFLFVLAEDGRTWEIPADVLPKHSISLDTRGAKQKHSDARKWDEYRVQQCPRA